MVFTKAPTRLSPASPSDASPEAAGAQGCWGAAQAPGGFFRHRWRENHQNPKSKWMLIIGI